MTTPPARVSRHVHRAILPSGNRGKMTMPPAPRFSPPRLSVPPVLPAGDSAALAELHPFRFEAPPLFPVTARPRRHGDPALTGDYPVPGDSGISRQVSQSPGGLAGAIGQTGQSGHSAVTANPAPGDGDDDLPDALPAFGPGFGPVLFDPRFSSVRPERWIWHCHGSIDRDSPPCSPRRSAFGPDAAFPRLQSARMPP